MLSCFSEFLLHTRRRKCKSAASPQDPVDTRDHLIEDAGVGSLDWETESNGNCGD
jgi:hypothetical protein